MATLTTAIELVELSHRNASQVDLKYDSPDPKNATTSHVEAAIVEENRSIDTPQTSVNETESSEFRLPSYKNLAIVLGGNALMQIAFFIIVSSASLYASVLGGTATFSGLVIGIPTVFSGLALLVITRYDGARYNLPLVISYVSIILGGILYALAYPSKFLYLILIGRMVTGLGFIGFMYTKRYCSDPRVVGIRRRTTLASWLVVGQGIGTSLGPWLGGALFKVARGENGKVWNGLTSPGWVMAAVFLLFLVVSWFLFEDVPKKSEASTPNQNQPALVDTEEDRRLTLPRAFVLFMMCYTSMTCFFVLGSWESNIPVFTSDRLGYDPFQAGNFLALGGACAFPFLLGNVWWSMRRSGGIQDRTVLGVGTGIGTAGIIILLSTLIAEKVSFAPIFVAWFLVALGFNLSSTCTLSLLSKQLPNSSWWNKRTSMAIQYANYTGRVTGAVLGGAGVKMGMRNYLGVQLGIVGLGGLMYVMGWKRLKVKLG